MKLLAALFLGTVMAAHGQSNIVYHVTNNALYGDACTNIGWDITDIVTNVNTNGYLVRLTNWCEIIDAADHEQAVRDLAAGGVICRVLGHQWRDGRPGEAVDGLGGFFADYRPGVSYRTCRVCGVCQSKKEGEWE